ncbi:MAG: hypothetical protein RLZ98_3062 [Pseudomonadota bacterium]|jgi:putative thioredoxin
MASGEENSMAFGFGGEQSKPADGDIIKDTNTQAFAQDVIQASQSALVLVDFWAAWCGPCKQLTPVLEKVVKAYGGKVRLVKLNVDEHPAIPGQLRIQSLPTVYAFRDGRPLDGFMGAQPESAIKEFIDRLLGAEAGDDIDALLAAASEQLEANNLQGAAEIYAAILQEDGQNVKALAGLANCYLKSGDAVRAEQTLSLIPPDKQGAAEVTQVKAAIQLALRAGSGADTRPLEARLAANPNDHQARLDLALALAAGGEKDRAADELLEIFRRDRTWGEDAARRELVQLFDAWGPTDPATLAGRRKLSSLLFS